MDTNMQIRKLRPGEIWKLARILSISDAWKKLVGIIPKEGTEDVPIFNGDHVAEPLPEIDFTNHQSREDCAS